MPKDYGTNYELFRAVEALRVACLELLRAPRGTPAHSLGRVVSAGVALERLDGSAPGREPHLPRLADVVDEWLSYEQTHNKET